MSTLQPQPGSALPSDKHGHVYHDIDPVCLIAEHEELARLCDQLEACADALPVWPSDIEVEHLCRALEGLAARSTESSCFFVADTLPWNRCDPLTAALARHIKSHYVADLVHAQDLTAALRSGPMANGRITAETLGYMLRCFFAARRQTLAFEELAILMLGQHRMTPAERSMLIDSLCRRTG